MNFSPKKSFSQKQALTKHHYDTFPYEVGVQNSEVYRSVNNPIGRFLNENVGTIFLDLGCGPGNLIPSISQSAKRIVGIDISKSTLELAEKTSAGLPVDLIQGSILELPFMTNTFETVIAAGSLHHTPDAQLGFKEACRVLSLKGRGFFAIYRAKSYYYYLYYTMGTAARVFEKYTITKWLVNRIIFLPLFTLYFIMGRLISHGKLKIPTRGQVVSYFADQIINPVVSFHTMAEIETWIAKENVKLDWIVLTHAGALINFAIHSEKELAQ